MGEFPRKQESVLFPNIPPKIPETSGRNSNGTKIPCIKKIRNLFFCVSSFPLIPENAIPFATGNFCELKLASVIEWKGPQRS